MLNSRVRKILLSPAGLANLVKSMISKANKFNSPPEERFSVDSCMDCWAKFACLSFFGAVAVGIACNTIIVPILVMVVVGMVGRFANQLDNL